MVGCSEFGGRPSKAIVQGEVAVCVAPSVGMGAPHSVHVIPLPTPPHRSHTMGHYRLISSAPAVENGSATRNGPNPQPKVR